MQSTQDLKSSINLLGCFLDLGPELFGFFWTDYATYLYIPHFTIFLRSKSNTRDTSIIISKGYYVVITDHHGTKCEGDMFHCDILHSENTWNAGKILSSKTMDDIHGVRRKKGVNDSKKKHNIGAYGKEQLLYDISA